MKKKFKTFFSRVDVLAVMITMGIFLVVCYMKHIYPFGNNSITNCDMTQSYVTFYHYLYDVFHGGKSIFYNFELGMGSNIYGGFVMDGFFHPTSWLIAFSSRSKIIYNMTFIVMIKFMVVAFSTSYFVHKVFGKIDKKVQIIGILMYVFSGYVFLNYSNIMWVDIVGLFPLLCLGIYRILKYQKMAMFTLILSLCLINNYNLAYMILFFLFFGVPFAVHYMAVNKRKAVSQLILGTILSIGLSAFAFIPAFYQTMTSYRMSGVVTNEVSNTYFYYKLVNILFCVLPLIYVFLLRKDFFKDKIVRMLYGMIVTTFLIPLFFERVNLLWHTGSYQCFPFRYGFVINFILVVVFFYGYSKYNFSFLNQRFRWLKIGVPLGLLSIFCFLFWYVMYQKLNYFDIFTNFSEIFLFQMIVLFSWWVVIAICEKKKEVDRVRYLLCFQIVMIVVYGVSFLGHSDDNRFSNEYADRSVLKAVQFYDELQIKNHYRIKDTTISMTENYPLVMDVASNSTFLHIISSDQVLNYQRMGYSSNRTKLNDYGGTLLSDTIYGTKYIIYDKEIHNEIYQLYKKVGEYYIYENPYTRFIYPVSTFCEMELGEDVYRNQNQLFEEIMGQDNLLHPLYQKCSYEGEQVVCRFDLMKEELYFYAVGKFRSITVNGEVVMVPYISVDDNIIYNRDEYISGILDLGYYDGEVEVIIDGDYVMADQLYFASLSVMNYQNVMKGKVEEVEFSFEGNKMVINYNNELGYEGLFVPINYDDGFSYLLNGKEQVIQKVLGNFMFLKLEYEDNYLELEFMPKYFKESLLVSAISVVILFIIAFYERIRKSNDREWKWLTYPLYGIGILIVLFANIKVYLLPIVETFFSVF